MNILMITGSPRRHGTTARLAEAFIEGATAAGHKVDRFDAGFQQVEPCKACYYCRNNGGVCKQDDDMQPLLGEEGKILKADAIVFVTPLYYYGMTAQLKLVLDRFYAVGRNTRGRKQKALLIAAAGDTADWTMDALKMQFTSTCRWAQWEPAGMVLAFGCHEPKDLKATSYEEEARSLGKNL